MTPHRVTVLLRFTANLPADEQAADSAADELGKRLAASIAEHPPAAVHAATVELLDSTATALTPPAATTEPEPLAEPDEATS